MKNSLIAATGLALSISGVAFAQNAPQFAEVDSNADGVLNKQEADRALPALGISDANQDGIITKADVKKVLPDIDFTGDDESAVGATEYEKIVAILEGMMNEA